MSIQQDISVTHNFIENAPKNHDNKAEFIVIKKEETIECDDEESIEEIAGFGENRLR
jgi:hypothetical protein